jgi:hypothetical protein
MGAAASRKASPTGSAQPPKGLRAVGAELELPPRRTATSAICRMTSLSDSSNRQWSVGTKRQWRPAAAGESCNAAGKSRGAGPAKAPPTVRRIPLVS